MSTKKFLIFTTFLFGCSDILSASCPDGHCDSLSYTCTMGMCLPRIPKDSSSNQSVSFGAVNVKECPKGGAHDMGPHGKRYDWRVQMHIGRKFYECWRIIPMVQWACKKCGAPSSDVRDTEKPELTEGSECAEYQKDNCERGK